MFKTMLIGNLGADAQLQVIQNGKKVINFNVAVTKKYRYQSGDIQEKTTWVGVSYWNDNADKLLPYLKKGQQVYCEGEMSARAWNDNNNKLQAALNLTCFSLQLLGGKKEQTTAAPANIDPAEITEPLDDLPF